MIEVKIISDGNPMHTKVIDKAMGEELKHVRNITYKIGVGILGTAQIEFINVVAELEGKLIDVTGLGQKYRTYKKMEGQIENGNS